MAGPNLKVPSSSMAVDANAMRGAKNNNIIDKSFFIRKLFEY